VVKLLNTLYIVVPCFNEEVVLLNTANVLGEKITALASGGKISGNSKIVFVDDGSRDGTWGMIEELSAGESLFAGIKLSRNQGHQNALLAGLLSVRNEADLVISIDADLQDDIGAIDRMVDEFLGGCDIVYGVRQCREKDSFFKRATAEGYYKLLRKYGCDIVFNHADYRLMSSRALEALSEYCEQRLFIRGLVPLLGYKTAVVYYDRGVREAGESKYPLMRMLSLAFDGLFSLSLRPLRVVMALGALMLVVAAALLVYSVIALFMGRSVFDWKIVTFSIWLVGGAATFSLGIVGEYVGRTYIEVKRRPRFFVEKTIGLDD
jgi:glycosyltransferase involved in cell wall biosynthesis